MLVVDSNGRRRSWIPDDNVGISTWQDLPLLWMHAKESRRRRAAGFHPSFERDFTVDHALIHQLHSMLNTTDSVRNRSEISDTQLFLVLHAKRTVIG